MEKDPYAVLGVPKTASQNDIKTAYRKLAKKLHPDLNPGDKKVEAQFKEITSAYDTLSDPKKRAAHDAVAERPAGFGFGGAGFGGENAARRAPAGGAHAYAGNFDDDLFKTIFGGMGERRGRRANADFPGADVTYAMEVDLRDAALGAEREITLPDGRRLRVKIPAGVEPGTKLRFAGLGGAALGNAPPGDAYVEIQLAPSSEFKRVGRDIEVELAVSFADAILGGTARAPTLDGQVELKIPAGVTTGSRLRIRGKGWPDRSAGGARGDEIVVVKIATPPAEQIDAELREAVRRWREGHASSETAA